MCVCKDMGVRTYDARILVYVYAVDTSKRTDHKRHAQACRLRRSEKGITKMAPSSLSVLWKDTRF